MKRSLGISNFLEEISSLSHSVVFLYLFALIAEEGFLISPCYSLELCIQMGISFLFSFAFFFLFFNFTIFYWFCHISKWICHRYTCVPHPEPSSLPIPSLWVVPVHQPQASSIVHRTWTGDDWFLKSNLVFKLEKEKWKWSCSVVSDSFPPHGL